MDLRETIIEICSADGPSGFEEAAAELICKKLEGLADSMERDVLGNVIGRKSCGIEGAPLLMFEAHIDEVGFIITGYDKGFLRFDSLGGVDPRVLPSSQIRILTENGGIPGIIGVMPVHVLSADEMDKPLPIDKLFIDVGMTAEEAEKNIPLGTYAVFGTEAAPLGESQICGKALDNRAGAAILLKVLEELQGEKLRVDLAFLFSVQEEMGLRGATVGAYSISPDYAVAIDVTHAKTPDAPAHKTFELGGGAAIGVGPNMTRSFSDYLIKLVKQENIKYQIEVMAGSSGTDAWAIQISRTGVVTAVVSLPIKYMHTPIETMEISDAEAIINLLKKLALNIGEGL